MDLVLSSFVEASYFIKHSQISTILGAIYIHVAFLARFGNAQKRTVTRPI